MTRTKQYIKSFTRSNRDKIYFYYCKGQKLIMWEYDEFDGERFCTIKVTREEMKQIVKNEISYTHSTSKVWQSFWRVGNKR